MELPQRLWTVSLEEDRGTKGADITPTKTRTDYTDLHSILLSYGFPFAQTPDSHPSLARSEVGVTLELYSTG